MGVIRTKRDTTLRDRARRLRREDTRAEAQLWEVVRDRRLGGWRWQRQVPIPPFVVDFYCAEGRLIVELDGGQHAEQAAYDAARTAYLGRLGLRVLRFWNNEVLSNRNGVCLTILDHLGGDRPGWDSLAVAAQGCRSAAIRR